MGTNSNSMTYKARKGRGKKVWAHEAEGLVALGRQQLICFHYTIPVVMNFIPLVSDSEHVAVLSFKRTIMYN